jgi:hypothetical protein
MLMLSAVTILLCIPTLITALYWAGEGDYISDDVWYKEYITIAGTVLAILLVAIILTALVVLLGELSASPNLKGA